MTEHEQSKVRALAEAEAREANKVSKANKGARKVNSDHQVRFEWRGGCLEAGTLAGDREWCWWAGDLAVVITDGGQITGTLDVPKGASVTTVKALIRSHNKGGI